MNREAHPGEINHAMFDRFSLAHMLVGYLLGMWGVGVVPATLAAVAWEIVENPLKDALPALFPHATHDTGANVAGDVAAWMVGWGLAQRSAR